MFVSRRSFCRLVRSMVGPDGVGVVKILTEKGCSS